MRDRSSLAFIGRLLLAAIFFISGLMKLLGPASTAAVIEARGLSSPLVLAIAAGLIELVCGVFIAIGYLARGSALVLFLYLIPVTIVFHSPAGLSGMEAQGQIVQILKNLAIMGGLLVEASFGPGAVSIDERKHRPRTPPIVAAHAH